MDCQTFHDSEIDALYGELDDEAAAAMTSHAEGCPECAARFERLRGTRARVLSVAVEAVPTDFESRIMAAVDAGGASGAVNGDPTADAPPAERRTERTSEPPLAAPAAKPEGGATIYRFLSRPSFAVAATFVLVLGAAAFMITRGGMSKMEAPAASQESAPAARAAEADNAVASPVAMATATAAPASPVAEEAQMAAPPLERSAAQTAGGALALNERSPPPPAPTSASLAKAGPGASRPAASPADARAFADAKALAAAGRCSEALPKLEALKSTVPAAELDAARCVATTSGCAAAAPRFDIAAQRNAGTEIGSRASIEGAKCYRATGELAEARKRLVAAKDEGVLEAEATTELDALDRSGAPAAGGAAHGGARAAPKAARPAAIEPAAPPAPANR
jgi:anti-sigma factor RsiW